MTEHIRPRASADMIDSLNNKHVSDRARRFCGGVLCFVLVLLQMFQANDFLGHGAFDWIRSVAAKPDCLSYLVKSVAPKASLMLRRLLFEILSPSLFLAIFGRVYGAKGYSSCCIGGCQCTAHIQKDVCVCRFGAMRT